MELRLKYPPEPKYAAAHADVCVSAAWEISGADLDYSISSLGVVDSILEEFRRDGVRGEQIAETLFAFGCYVGEVFVRNDGASWYKIEDTPLRDIGGYFLVLKIGPDSFVNPIGKVFKRVRNGIEDSLPYFYEVFAAKAHETAQDASKGAAWRSAL
jgi:hypothetical protein